MIKELIDLVEGVFTFDKKNTAVKQSAQSSLDPIGAPRIIVRDREGNVVKDFRDHNLVVNIGRNALVRILTGEYSSRIAAVELGKGGTVGDPWTPVNPTAADIGLTTPLSPAVSKSISGFAYAAGTHPTSVDFSVIFESYEVDEIVSEAILKFLDGKIYARYTFPSIYLKADKGYSMEIIWTVQFS